MKRSLLTLFAVTGLLLAGCATSQKSDHKEDAAAAERSQAYLSGVDLVAASDRMSGAKPCLVPSSANKPAPGLGAGPSKDWRQLVAHADTCVKEKNWKTLETLAAAIARMDIDSPWGAYFLSLSAEGSGDLPRALWMADLAQKKAGGRSGLFSYQKGRLLYALKDTPAAMREVEHAVGLDPNLAEGQAFLGEIHQRDLETSKAASCYQLALNADPKMYRALVGLAEVKLDSGKPEEAADLYTKAIAQRPDQLRPWVRLAYIYETVQKNTPLALNTYKGLKAQLEKGDIRERPQFDLNVKIKALEDSAKSRVPAAQAAADSKTVKK